MAHVAIYVRISSDPEGLRLGVERQIADAQEVAARLHPGIPVVVYEDNDVSAWKGARRPQYESLCHEIEVGHVSGLVVYNLDRLHRHPRELEHFLDLCEKVRLRQVHTVEGDLDLTTHDGQLMARIMAAVGKKESDDKSRRVKRALHQMARDGLPTGGRRPFGYQGLELVPAEADAIRRAADIILNGGSFRSAHKSIHPFDWSRTTLRGILISPRIAGLRVHQGEVIGPAAWPAIVTLPEHERLKALLRPYKACGAPQPRRWYLSYVATCGVCGGPLQGGIPYRGQHHYRCLNLCVSIGAHIIEPHVAGAIQSLLDTPRFDALMQRDAPDDLDDMLRESAELDARLNALAADYANGDLTRGEWQVARAALIERIDEMQLRIREVAAETRIGTQVHVIRGAWEGLDVTQRHDLALLLFKEIRVDRSRNRHRDLTRIHLTPIDDLRGPS